MKELMKYELGPTDCSFSIIDGMLRKASKGAFSGEIEWPGVGVNDIASTGASIIDSNYDNCDGYCSKEGCWSKNILWYWNISVHTNPCWFEIK